MKKEKVQKNYTRRDILYHQVIVWRNYATNLLCCTYTHNQFGQVFLNSLLYINYSYFLSGRARRNWRGTTTCSSRRTLSVYWWVWKVSETLDMARCAARLHPVWSPRLQSTLYGRWLGPLVSTTKLPHYSNQFYTWAIKTIDFTNRRCKWLMEFLFLAFPRILYYTSSHVSSNPWTNRDLLIIEIVYF